MIRSSDKLDPGRNNSSKSAFSKNYNNRLAFRKNNGNSEVDRFGSNDIKHVKKSRKSKGQNLSKSQKSAKSEKKLLKSANLSNFNAKTNKSYFLTSIASKTFNRLWQALTKALIL